MARKEIVFRLTAFSAAAGKYNPEAPLDGNEDNFYVDDDLNDDILGRFQTDVDITMSECGCLMVVADGMGGMNAGEVASELAIETVKDFFAPGKITPAMAESPVERRKYLENVIKEADRRIKTDARENPAHEGMGSTIILAWIVGDKMTVSWCGDSRAYRFNPVNGLEPLSRDHSYVQELVNKRVLKYEDTFEHPQGNIVTRSLGDPNNAAKPETRQFDVYNEDIILLCSDGLSGVLRDRKTKDHNGIYYPGENIEDIIAAHTSSMTECRDALLAAAEKADWYDNVTVLLCQIESGAEKAPKKGISKTRILLGAGGLLLLVAILCGGFYYLGLQKGEAGNEAKEILMLPKDSVAKDNTVPGGEVVQGEGVENPTSEAGGETATGSKVNPNGKSASDSDNKAAVTASERDWRQELAGKLDRVSEPSWVDTRVKPLKDELRTATDKSRRSLTKRVNDLVTYFNYLTQVRGLQGKLNDHDKQLAEGLEKKILDHNIGLNDCKNAVNELKQRSESYGNRELTITPAEDNPNSETPIP